MARLKIELEDLLLNYIRLNSYCSSSQIHENAAKEVAYATVKRCLRSLIENNLIIQEGKGKSSRYRISPAYELLRPINTIEYFSKEIDERTIKKFFDFSLLTEILPKIKLFTDTELGILNSLQLRFHENSNNLSEADFRKEFERLAIDLSWKSSQIEGNTYSLLETERLLKEQVTASGKTRDEATMLLNHKYTLDFLLEHPSYLNPVTTSGIEDIHSMLIKDLHVSRNIRIRKVGISGTNYTPLDNEFQIREAMNDLCTLINDRDNVFEKALLAILLLSYIQPFMDGNKRTARIVSNAILMHHHNCPLSFRTVDSIDYKKAMLLFYEQNNLLAFKKIFIEQYEFAVNTYF